MAGFVVALKRKLFACYCCDREEKVTRYWLYNNTGKQTSDSVKISVLALDSLLGQGGEHNIFGYPGF